MHEISARKFIPLSQKWGKRTESEKGLLLNKESRGSDSMECFSCQWVNPMRFLVTRVWTKIESGRGNFETLIAATIKNHVLFNVTAGARCQVHIGRWKPFHGLFIDKSRANSLYNKFFSLLPKKTIKIVLLLFGDTGYVVQGIFPRVKGITLLPNMPMRDF